MANDAAVVRPQAAALTVDSGSPPRIADVLTRKPSGDDIGAAEHESLPVISDVSESRNSREMSLKYPPAKWVYLYLPNCLDARTLETQVEAADTCKQRTVRQLQIPSVTA